MRDKTSFRLLIFLLIFTVFFAFQALFSLTAQAELYQVEYFQESEVEILILLKDQADTVKAAENARETLPAASAIGQEKAAVRTAVYNALKQKADSTQGSLIKYLVGEMAKGRVSDIKSYYLVNLVFARVPESMIEIIARRPDVDSVWPNLEIHLIEPLETSETDMEASSIQWNVAHIGASQVWEAFNIDGAGVVVGIIDTGVDWQHEALKEKYRGYNPASPDNPTHSYNWFDPYYSRSYPDDPGGHGSHSMGIVLGSDPAGDYMIGVAPGARWIAARGLNDDGSGTFDNILAAMEFMLAPTANLDGSGVADPTLAPDIVNNSYSAQVTGCNLIFKQAIANWRAAEIFPVFAADNKGPDPGTVGLPAIYAESLAVGSTDNNDNLAEISSRGPGVCGEFWKPDISAPGVDILSVQSYKDLNSPVKVRPRGYKVYSGTSMAAPHIAGVAALLRSADSTLTVDQLEQIIVGTAVPLTDSDYPESPNHGYGYGRVDAYAAVVSITDYAIAVSADPAKGGTVSGGGMYNYGETVTVSAVANEGYIFFSWVENGVYVSALADYSFTVTGERFLKAKFQQEMFSLSYSAGDYGSLDGILYQIVGYGDSGSPVEAVPDQGYYFLRWNDGSTDNPRTDINVTEDINVTAEFKKIIYDFTLRLEEGWNILSLPRWAKYIDYDEADIETCLIFEMGEWMIGNFEDDLNNPTNVVFIKIIKPTEMHFVWAESNPILKFASKQLYPGWNLISTGIKADYQTVLADLRYDGEGGLTQIYAPNIYNGRKDDNYKLPWDNPFKDLLVVNDSDSEQMSPMDGYWVYLHGDPALYVSPVSWDWP